MFHFFSYLFLFHLYLLLQNPCLPSKYLAEWQFQLMMDRPKLNVSCHPPKDRKLNRNQFGMDLLIYFSIFLVATQDFNMTLAIVANSFFCLSGWALSKLLLASLVVLALVAYASVGPLCGQQAESGSQWEMDTWWWHGSKHGRFRLKIGFQGHHSWTGTGCSLYLEAQIEPRMVVVFRWTLHSFQHLWVTQMTDP